MQVQIESQPTGTQSDSPTQIALSDSEEVAEESLLQKYQIEFQGRLQQCFEEERESELRGLLDLVNRVGNEIRQEPELQELFNLSFLRRLVKLCSSASPIQIRGAVYLIDAIMHCKMIANRLLHQRGCERIIVDLTNSLMSLQQQLKHTSLEPMLDRILVHLNSSEPDQKNILQSIRVTLKTMQENQNNNQFIKALQMALTQQQSTYSQFKLFALHLQEVILEYLILIKKDSDARQISHLNQLFAIYERFYFDASQQLMMDVHNIREQKLYILKIERQLQHHYFPYVYKSLSALLNMILIQPNEIGLQKRAFNMIRVIYRLKVMTQSLAGPLTLILRNISLFITKESIEFKEATMFLYELINASDYSEQQRKQWSDDEDLCYLRENKHFSVKALSLVDEQETVYSLKHLTISVLFPCMVTIEAASIYSFSIVVEKRNSVLYWSFRTVDFDISFGLFRLTQVEDLGINDFRNERNGVQHLIKLQRVDSNKQPITGVTLIQNTGFYRIVFDNSYSYLRAKQLYYQIHLLEFKSH